MITHHSTTRMNYADSPAHLGIPGQSPWGRKTVVVAVVSSLQSLLFTIIITSNKLMPINHAL